MAKKKSARRRSRKKGRPTKFSMKGGHTALRGVLSRLRAIRTPKSKRLQRQIQALLDETPCPQSMVIEL
jgi:hypothetical protein